MTATGDNPKRNFNEMAQAEFEDISHKVMLMMSMGDVWIAEQFAKLAKDFNTPLFLMLARYAIEEDADRLQSALEGVNGPTWRTKYRRACEKHGIEPAT